MISIVCVPARGAANDVVRPWEALGENLEGIYGWPNVLFHVSAAALTPPLVFTLDEPVQEFLQRDDPVADPFGEGASLFGGVAPIAFTLGIYALGAAQGEAELTTAGSAAIQAVVVQFVVVTTLKWLTDRAGPYPDGDPTQERWHGGLLRDSKHADDFDFNPFSLDGGLRWPSGHAASNVALVSALVAFYPDELWLALVGYPIALAIGAGMVEADYHWVSDIVAGALIGYVIGWVIGKEFRERFDAPRTGADHSAPVRTQLGPSAAPLGLRITGQF